MAYVNVRRTGQALTVPSVQNLQLALHFALAAEDLFLLTAPVVYHMQQKMHLATVFATQTGQVTIALSTSVPVIACVVDVMVHTHITVTPVLQMHGLIHTVTVLAILDSLV